MVLVWRQMSGRNDERRIDGDSVFCLYAEEGCFARNAG